MANQPEDVLILSGEEQKQARQLEKEIDQFLSDNFMGDGLSYQLPDGHGLRNAVLERVIEQYRQGGWQAELRKKGWISRRYATVDFSLDSESFFPEGTLPNPVVAALNEQRFEGPVLDFSRGYGQHAVYLAAEGKSPVIFVSKDRQALKKMAYLAQRKNIDLDISIGKPNEVNTSADLVGVVGDVFSSSFMNGFVASHGPYGAAVGVGAINYGHDNFDFLVGNVSRHMPEESYLAVTGLVKERSGDSLPSESGQMIKLRVYHWRSLNETTARTPNDKKELQILAHKFM